MRGLAWCVALTAACGGSGGGSGLDGDWVLEDSDVECSEIVTFDGDVVQFKHACVLDDDSLAVEVHTGSIESDDGKAFTWRLTASTCSDPALRPSTPQRIAHSMVGDGLRLVDEDGATVFHRASKSTATDAQDAHVAFGCFDADGYFTDAPLKPVR